MWYQQVTLRRYSYRPSEAITRSIVEAHRGSICCVSAAGLPRFTLTFPAAPAFSAGDGSDSR